MGDGMLCAAVWEEDENQSVGGEGWGAEDVCYWPWELYLWPSALRVRVGRWIFVRGWEGEERDRALRN